MNAHEILDKLRNMERREPGTHVTLKDVEFDPGSLEEQLWEEQAMLPTAIECGKEEKDGDEDVSVAKDWAAWASCRPAVWKDETLMEFEILEHIGSGNFVYRKVLQSESKHVRPVDYDMIATHRAERHLDDPVVYLEDESEHWRWGIQYSTVSDYHLALFYQERESESWPWNDVVELPHGIDLPFWKKIKLVVTKFG